MNSTLRLLIAALQVTGAAFAGFAMYHEVQQQHFTPVLFALNMVAFQICAIAFIGGILLFYNLRSGYILSAICQTLQIVAVTTSNFSFAFTFGCGAWININSLSEINTFSFDFHYFELHRFFIKQYVDSSYLLGVNLIAAYFAPALLMAMPASDAKVR